MCQALACNAQAEQHGMEAIVIVALLQAGVWVNLSLIT
jgi:hypothetical protein